MSHCACPHCVNGSGLDSPLLLVPSGFVKVSVMSPVKGRAHDCALKSGFPFGRRGVGPFRFAGAAPRAPRAWAPAGAGAMKMASTTAAVMVKVEECFIVSSFFDSILSAGFPSSLLPTTRAPLRDRIRKMSLSQHYSFLLSNEQQLRNTINRAKNQSLSGRYRILAKDRSIIARDEASAA